MPGVGVAPRPTPLLSSAGLGIPGVGVVPRGIPVAFAGIPGVWALLNVSGLAESPGGKFALSSVTITGPLLAFELAFELTVALPPHAVRMTGTKSVKSASNLYITPNKCAGLEVASLEGSDGGQTGTGRFIYRS
jgi:hypothetical protein